MPVTLEPCEGCGKLCNYERSPRFGVCEDCWLYLTEETSTAPKPVEPPDPELLDLLPES